MIEFCGVTVKFGDFTALPNYSLEVAEGEFFTLLGPSGCGKSTALRTLAGFISPSAGKICIGGRDVTSLPSHRRGVGMVFQNYALFPTLSVGENIAFGLKSAKVPAGEIRRRVAEIADQVQLTAEQLEKSVADLSGGQQQRVAIARALVLRPKILLLDEPLSNLDAALRKQLRVQLKELQQGFGITSLYVTHDQDEALTLSDRIAVMNQGRIEQVATPQEIYSRSATEFVCTFIGEAVRISPGDVAHLAGRGAGVSPQNPAYLRAEKVGLSRDRPASPGVIDLPGCTVASRTYHGMFSTYLVETPGGCLRAIAKEDGQPGFAPGDQVRLEIDPADILQYEDAPVPALATSPGGSS